MSALRPKSHWAPKMGKEDWAEDIRADLAKMLPNKAADLQLPTLKRLSASDLSRLAEAIDDILRRLKP